jgi:hypothetical protein
MVHGFGRVLGVWVLGFALLGGAGTVSVRAFGEETTKESRPVVDETQVYYGKAATCKAPSVLDADKVFQAIPEYRKILDGKLTEKDVEYSVLLVKANRKFRAAVEGAATDKGYDLVGGLGSVTWKDREIPDLTDAAVKKVADQAAAGG